MKIALHEITTRDGSFEEHLAAYEKTSWTHFEINLGKAGEYFDQHGEAVTAKRVRDHGLTCVAATGRSLNAFGGAKAQQQDFDEIEKIGERMQALGCGPLVVGGPSPENLDADNYAEALDRFAQHLDAVAEKAALYGVTLAVEVNWARLCRSFRSAAHLLERVTQTNVGLIWDPAHFVSTPSRLADLDAFNGRIVHAHLNDMNTEFYEVVQINADRVIPGEGHLPLRAWTDKVTACGYDGWHSVELFNEKLWAEDLETICEKVMAGCKTVWPEAVF